MTETVKLKRQKHKKNIILIYLEYIPVLILYHIFLLLPLSAAYRVGRFCFGVANYFDWKHRRRTISHLLHAGVVSTLQDARKTAHEVYCKMGMLFVEIIQMSKCYDPSRFRLTGDAEAVRWIEEEEPNRSFIFLTAHYGNWEFAGPAIADYCRTPLTSIMRPFSNPKIGELVLKHRRSPMHTLVGKEGGIRDLLRALKRNQMVAVLVDQACQLLLRHILYHAMQVSLIRRLVIVFTGFGIHKKFLVGIRAQLILGQRRSAGLHLQEHAHAHINHRNDDHKQYDPDNHTLPPFSLSAKIGRGGKPVPPA